MTGRLTRIRRYPIKGMTGEDLAAVALTPGRGLPGDRRFAIAHGSARFDAGGPVWLPKSNFLTLMRNERLALLEARYDAEDGALTIRRNGRPVLKARLAEPSGRLLVEQFFASFMSGESRGTPRLVEASGGMLTDVPEPFVSLVNLASVRDLERVARGPVDPARFRANLYLDGLPAWGEAAWVGREIAVGATRLRVVESISRCAATEVNPASARRDLNIPSLLQRGFGHCEMGVYAEVVGGGGIAPDDPVALVPGG